ncbi:unknown seed protein like 1 [Striga hermonthica]|uniref:BURP domain-containing protein n=1 Tax=Striga hermonthica TaxID=68872 RepID=A0A9N7RE49_STRHE|nr:unknown seed protein like 1 [Striga hermonthica]
MGSKLTPLLIFCLVFFIKCLKTTSSHTNREHGHQAPQHDQKTLPSENDPELSVFFHHNTLQTGTKLRLYFPTNEPSTSPRLLSRQESDSIPFSSSQLPSILRLFSLTAASKQALAMRATLDHCESPPITGESKFCATSLESMLDSLRSIFGFRSEFRVITTNYPVGPMPVLRNYTVIEAPVEISARRIVGCHVLPYPYAVFYCHSQDSDNKLYEVSLSGEDGERVEAVAMCHMDTREWDSDHVAFRVLGIEPGGPPVCHFFPPDNLVWVST